MPDQAAARTFSEDEHLAILADRVAQETASLTTKIEAKDAEIASLKTDLDKSEASRLAAEQARDDAQREFADFKEQVENERQRAQRKDERVAKVKEVASHLGDEFFTDERVERIVAMTDDEFGGYVSDMSDIAKVPPVNSGAPRETAGLTGAPVPASESNKTATAARNFLLRGFTPKEG